jgi:hypothetical protein
MAGVKSFTKTNYSRYLILLVPVVGLSCGDEAMNDSDENSLIVPGPIYNSEEPVSDSRLLPLGQQFLESLRENDVRKFCGCWFSAEERLEQLKAAGGIDWTPDVIAHYRKLFELDVELAAIYHGIYRSSLAKYSEHLQDITLDHVRATAKVTTVSVFVRLPNQSLIEFRIDGADEANGHWKFYGHPSSLLEITETEDGIPETTFADPISPQMKDDLERVLSEIAAGYDE